ncbi:MAG: CRTAC1 family protein [Acidobacteriota bacterium]
MNPSLPFVRPVAFLFIVAVAALTPMVQGQSNPPGGVDTIVGAIEKLEDQRDPKCHATASRLEGFMYGTPLTEAARDRKVDLQKKLILSIWTKASTEAKAQQLPEVSTAILEPIAAAALRRSVLPNGDVEVTLASGQKLLLESRDVRQYGTVAYALRAILSVQQDALLSPDLHLAPLSTDAVNTLKSYVDNYTLAALNLSDKIARIKDEKELQPATFAAGWGQIAPADAGPVVTAKLERRAGQSKPGEVLRKIMEQKLASFASYNGKVDPIFFSNIRVFYARYPWPEAKPDIEAIGQAFSAAAMDFVADWILKSQEQAKQAGHAVVRESDVAAVFAKNAPYKVNEFEDVIFFANLSKEKQLYIEAYDADSFRDSGLHWQLFKQVIDSPGFPLKMDFDPFAAELLSEGTAQIGVLLFREAGLMAREAGSSTLKAEFIPKAEKRIAQLMKEQISTPAPARPPQKLASSPLSTKTSGKYFDDITLSTKLDFTHRSSDWLSRFQRTFLYSVNGAPEAPKPGQDVAHDVAPSFSGSGVAADDIDGDGFADILIVGGVGNKLYLNDGHGAFRDVTAEAGIDWLGPDGKPGEPRQPLIIDFDNDGREDILITYVNAGHRLYRNVGEKGAPKFIDVTDQAGLGGEGLVGSAAAALDYDRDGLIDLYVGYYGNYVQGQGPNLARKNFNATPNKLFRNVGNMQFKEVVGSGTENTGWTQAVAAVDFDNDGWQDLIVGNDFGVNSWYRNLGNGKFEDVAPAYGTDIPANSMNVGTADLNGDGLPDVYISNILTMVKDEKYVLPTEETKMKLNPKKLATMRVVGFNHLFTSEKAGKGKEEKYELSDAIDREDTSTGWAWDADFFDFDNDGDDDLYVVNGLNEYKMYDANFDIKTPSGDKQTWMFSVHDVENNVFFVNEQGKLRNRSADSGADLAMNSRSAAYLDYDNDGDLDIVINNFNGPAVFLRNNAEKLSRHWIELRLVGDPSKHSNLDAIGAELIVSAGGKKEWREVQGGTGYLSQHPKVQHVGLGAAKTADVTITWPNGDVQTVKGLEADKLHVIRQ